MRDPRGLDVIEALAPQVSRYAQAMCDGVYSAHYDRSAANIWPELTPWSMDAAIKAAVTQMRVYEYYYGAGVHPIRST